MTLPVQDQGISAIEGALRTQGPKAAGQLGEMAAMSFQLARRMTHLQPRFQ